MNSSEQERVSDYSIHLVPDRTIRPVRLEAKLAIQVACAIAEFCGLLALAAVGGDEDGASFRSANEETKIYGKYSKDSLSYPVADVDTDRSCCILRQPYVTASVVLHSLHSNRRFPSEKGCHDRFLHEAAYDIYLCLSVPYLRQLATVVQDTIAYGVDGDRAGATLSTVAVTHTRTIV